MMSYSQAIPFIRKKYYLKQNANIQRVGLMNYALLAIGNFVPFLHYMIAAPKVLDSRCYVVGCLTAPPRQATAARLL